MWSTEHDKQLYAIAGYWIITKRIEYENSRGTKKQSVKNDHPQKNSNSESIFQLVDNRLDVISQRGLQEMSNSSNLQRLTIQRTKDDVYTGIITIKPSNRSLAIYVHNQIRPWFNLPDSSGLIEGDSGSFTEGDDRAVTGLVKTGHNQTNSEREEELNKNRVESSELFVHSNGEVLYFFEVQNGNWGNLNRESDPDEPELMAQDFDALFRNNQIESIDLVTESYILFSYDPKERACPVR